MPDMIREDVLNMIIGLLVLVIVILATMSIDATLAGILVSIFAALITLIFIIVVGSLGGIQSLSEFHVYLTIAITGSVGLFAGYVLFCYIAIGPTNPIIIAICSPIAFLLECLLFIYYIL